jgi:hypothetical protein
LSIFPSLGAAVVGGGTTSAKAGPPARPQITIEVAIKDNSFKGGTSFATLGAYHHRWRGMDHQIVGRTANKIPDHQGDDKRAVRYYCLSVNRRHSWPRINALNLAGAPDASMGACSMCSCERQSFLMATFSIRAFHEANGRRPR